MRPVDSVAPLTASGLIVPSTRGGVVLSVFARVPSRLLLVAGLVLAFLVLPATASADRAFTPRFSTNDTGAIVMAANTLMTCPDANANCAAARNAAASPVANNNSASYSMQYVDVDADPTTFNSSTATLSLPAGAEVLFAGLYWHGQVPTNNPAAPLRGTVLFQPPGAAGYQTLTGSVDNGTIPFTALYQGFADVTSIVQQAGPGDYAVANVQALTGTGRNAGWALVVAYRDASEPARNLTIFDGYRTMSVNGIQDIAVSGFLTPLSGPVATDLGFVAIQGDISLTDSAQLNGVTLTDAVKPANNFFNSAISRDGVHVTTKNPNYVNQLGFDAFTIAAPPGSLGNDQTSATIRLNGGQEVYGLGVVTFATELYAPQIQAVKSLVDVNGGQVEPGDTLDYTVTLTNTGDDAASDVVVTDPIPVGTTFVPGSLEIDGAGKTDVAGDDEAEFDAGANEATWRVGTGASATSGGTLVPGASVTVSLSVTVNVDVAAGTEIANEAVVSYNALTLGTSFATAAAVATSTVSPTAADLALSKDVRPSNAEKGETVTYTLGVVNNGPSIALDVLVEDELPAGLTIGSVSEGCTVAGQTVICAVDVLLAGESATFEIDAVVDSDSATLENTATAASSTPDAVPGNDTATVTLKVVAGVTPGVPPAAPPEPGPEGPTCDPLVRPCNPPPTSGGQSPSGDQPPAWPPTESEGGPATGQARMPDLRGTVSASWDGSTLHVVLRLRIDKPRLVTGSFAVNLAIPGVLDRTVRVSPNGRTTLVRSIDIPASALTGNPEGARLVARFDPARRIAEFRERNNTARTVVG